MKLIFLHGLGQDVLSWQGVQFALSPLHSKTFDIFSHPKESYQEVKERLMERLQQESEPFILVGLSLGGVLALDLSRQDFPQLKGLVLAGTQYKLNTNPLYRLQILLFRLLPKHVFEKQDANKQQMLQILTELKGLNLTDTAKACPLPSLVICGSRDWPINLLLKNWPSSCQKAAIKKSQTEVIYSIPRNPMNSRKPSKSLLLNFKMKRLTFRTVILNIYKVIFKTFLR